MPRLRNALTGAVVSCSNETAARLGGEWQPDPATAAKKAPAKRAATKKATASVPKEG